MGLLPRKLSVRTSEAKEMAKVAKGIATSVASLGTGQGIAAKEKAKVRALATTVAKKGATRKIAGRRLARELAVKAKAKEEKAKAKEEKVAKAVRVLTQLKTGMDGSRMSGMAGTTSLSSSLRILHHSVPLRACSRMRSRLPL